jgi:membrane protein implicated in regulation of membrane protease activity
LLSFAIPFYLNDPKQSRPEFMDLFLIYLICFGTGLLFTLVTAFTSHLWGGHDAGGGLGQGAGGHAEAGFGTHDMPGFSALSPTTIASFVTAFGGFGMIFHWFETTRSPWVSLPLSVLGGFGVAAAVLWLFRLVFSRTQASSESRVATLVGTMATVITPIGANGVGEIAYVQTGTRYSAPARGEDNTTFANGATVRITRIVGTQFYVAAV